MGWLEHSDMRHERDVVACPFSGRHPAAFPPYSPVRHNGYRDARDVHNLPGPADRRTSRSLADLASRQMLPEYSCGHRRQNAMAPFAEMSAPGKAYRNERQLGLSAQ